MADTPEGDVRMQKGIVITELVVLDEDRDRTPRRGITKCGKVRSGKRLNAAASLTELRRPDMNGRLLRYWQVGLGGCLKRDV